jgi:hypothetical protein
MPEALKIELNFRSVRNVEGINFKLLLEKVRKNGKKIGRKK